jgi:hypothetical protein
MTIVRVKGFKIFLDRHGRWRCYHRKTGTPIDLAKSPLGSAEFFADCARISALMTATAPKPGTLGMLISAYRDHPAFRDLAPRTRSDYQGVFEYLRPIADTPLVKFDRPLVVRIRDKAAASRGRKFANDVKARLSTLFGWGSERGYLAGNVASNIKDIRRPKGKPDANRPWADEERDAVLAASPAHMRPAIALMMFTGLGPRDALALPRTYIRRRRDRHAALEDGRAGILALPCPVSGRPGGCATAQCDYAMRQLHRAAVDVKRLQGLLAARAAPSGGGRQGRPRPDALRPAAHRGGHPARDRLRRANHCRRLGTEND